MRFLWIFPIENYPRLKNYDYSTENYYFVTICTADKKHLFWDRGKLSAMGQIAKEELEKIPEHYNMVAVDKYVVMPNHIHAILIIGCGRQSGKMPTLSSVVGSYKSGVSRRIHQLNPMVSVWQKSFYDSVIRNDPMYREIWNYIEGNPMEWESDEH